MNLPGLTLLERWVLRLLHRSPRISLVIVKPIDTTLLSWSLLPSDPVACAMADQLDMGLLDDDEPLSMQLERIYHQPSYGERE
jgi:hypothetical protein